MALIVDIACMVLRVITTGIVLLNEVALVAAPWIVAPSASSTFATPFPNPLILSLAYACLEPLLVALIARLGVDPWIDLLVSVQHVGVAQLPVEYVLHLNRMHTRAISGTAATSDYKPKDQSEAEQNSNKSKLVWRPTPVGLVAIILPIVSVAGSNAAFVLFAADIEYQLACDARALMMGMSYFALICYLGSRFGDYLITLAASKTAVWQRQSTESLSMQFSYLALVLFVKMTIRVLLGHSIFPVLQILGLGAMQPALAKELPAWLKATLEWKPPWPWPWWAKSIMNFATGGLQVYGLYLWRRGLAQRE